MTHVETHFEEESIFVGDRPFPASPGNPATSAATAHAFSPSSERSQRLNSRKTSTASRERPKCSYKSSGKGATPVSKRSPPYV